MKKIISIITKTLLVVAVSGSALYALATTPTTPPTNTGVSALVNTSAANQIKTGALGIGATDTVGFAAATTLGYKIVTDGGAVLGPTAVFGNFTATGPSITFSGLPNQSSGLCTDSKGKVVSCTASVGKTCGLVNSDATTKGCPAGAYLVQMSANGATGTCRWLDPTHMGGTTVPNTADMCY